MTRAVWLTVACGLVLFVAANAHLVYVALRSEPACVAGHGGDRGARYKPAEWSCAPTRSGAERGPE
jgi:hypothetical protein